MNDQIRTKIYKFDKSGTDRFVMPSFYKLIDKDSEFTQKQSLFFVYDQEEFSSTVSASMDDIKKSLPFDDPQFVIDELHHSFRDDQGLIEVNNGTTADARKFIYYINKYQLKSNVSSPGIGYHLCIHIDCGDKFLSILAYFEEAGITGIRDAMVLSFLESQGAVELDREKGIIGWMEDPYDPELKEGCLMNLSEQEIYDEFFPSHPLSQCRKLCNFFIATSMDDSVRR